MSVATPIVPSAPAPAARAKFVAQTVTLVHPPERVARALSGEIRRHLRPSGIFFVSPAAIRWTGAALERRLVGQVPFRFFGNNNYYGYLFQMSLASNGSATDVTIVAERSGFGKLIVPLQYIAGLMLCGVGVLFPLVLIPRLDARVNRWTVELKDALAAWDDLADVGSTEP